jgi:hypothetical protein
LRSDGDESPYQYCGGDPVAATDPWGLMMVQGTGAAGGGKKQTTTLEHLYAVYRDGRNPSQCNALPTNPVTKLKWLWDAPAQRGKMIGTALTSAALLPGNPGGAVAAAVIERYVGYYHVEPWERQHPQDAKVLKLMGSAALFLAPEVAAVRAAALAEEGAAAVAAAPGFARTQYARLSGSVRTTTLARSPTCSYCGKRASTEVDHIRALRTDWEGAGRFEDMATRSARVNNPQNLTGACRSCNASKGARELGQSPGQWWPPGWGDSWWPFQ